MKKKDSFHAILRSGIQFSRHAKNRMQQRGISETEVELAVQNGEIFYSHGDSLHVLREKSIAKMPGLPQHVRELAARKNPLCVIVLPDGVVKTAKWGYKRIKHNSRARPKNKRKSGQRG